jgi:four helix bundle protein
MVLCSLLTPKPIHENFEEIEGWQLARELTRKVYFLTSKGNFSRDFGLRDQIQRAAGSAMHNVAEGFDAGSNAEFVRFLRYAQRSSTEFQSQLYVALDQKYLSSTEFEELFSLAAHGKSKIGGLIKYLITNANPPTSSHD